MLKDLFKSEDKIIEEIHNQFDTAPDRVLAQANKILEDHVGEKLSEDLKKKARRLADLGFYNTRTVVAVSGTTKNSNKTNELISENRKTVELVEHYQKRYPFLKFLPETELDRICDKYNLVYAPVGHYIKDVPEANIKEIEDAQQLHVEDVPFNRYYFKATRFWNSDHYHDTQKLLKKGFEVPEHLVKEYFMEPRYTHYSGRTENMVKAYLTQKGMKHYYNPYDTGGVSTIDTSGLFIAAPSSHFDKEGLSGNGKGLFKFATIRTVKDPIVFRYVKGGVQVLTKWGKEAEDEALQIPQMN